MSSNGDAVQASNVYEVRRIQSYEGPCAHYEHPHELTSYSIDKDSKVWFDDREMRYYSPPKSGIKDLTSGYEQFIDRDINASGQIDALLDALTDLKIKTSQEYKADIVTLRKIMVKILRTPYSRKETWEFRATRYNGVIFIEEQVTEQKKWSEQTRTEHLKLMCFSGYKFQSLTTTKTPPSDTKSNGQELEDDVVNSNARYCAVVKSKLGNNSIIMSAEIDCCLEKKPYDPLKQPSNYVELTTARVIKTENQQNIFDRHKLLKYWAQSYLIGAPTTIIAFRDDQIQVVDVEEINILKAPEKLRGRAPGFTWDPAVCLNFADELLTWIISNISKDDAMITYSIKFDYPYRNVIIDCTGHSDIFLTQRFIDGTVQNAIGPRVQTTDTGDELNLALTNMHL